MDAKSRANFINSVAAGINVPCPRCGASNEPDSNYCVFCGAQITAPDEAADVIEDIDTDETAGTNEAADTNEAVDANETTDTNETTDAIETIDTNEDIDTKETTDNAPAFEPVKDPVVPDVPEFVPTYEETNNVFAQGLPDWSIEPPQVMVRRH